MSINGVTVRLKPFSQQPMSKLERGLLTVTNGKSGTTRGAWLDIEGRVVSLAPPRKQDKLTQGLIRVEVSGLDRKYFGSGLLKRGIVGNYAPIDMIGEIEKELYGLEALGVRLIRARQTLWLLLGLPLKPAHDYVV